ncbi:MAG: stage II sporulation protein P [Firmicutes bacterium HGW-Firmicutes-12]|jgi:stage II sporulation protein P|nr:MAG: stage II sporulation protein P [Firmicutes bacterium HGW-Firmicutes-12]
MKKIANKLVLYLGFALMIIGACFYYYETHPQVYNTLAEAGIELNILDNLGKWEGELTEGKYYTFKDENGKEIDQTVHEVFVGDELILEDNNRYKVVEVDDKNYMATCELVGQENISWREEWEQLPVLEVAQGQKKVGVYMTHNDESYKPTDGTESIAGDGGIMEVGATLAEILKKNNVDAQISNNKHDPHDANAYHRSRKTAVQLLRENPVALIDVHRDGVPDPNFYATNIDGNDATKIRLVVGRQNPHMSTNLEFAKQVKAYFDKKHPGLIKGIFMGKGNYNQDLGPKVFIIEVGTYTNHQEAAEKGVAEFAEGIPKILGASATGQGPGAGPVTTGSGKSLLWLLIAAVVGGGLFLLISSGSIKGSMKRLSGFGKEFSNYFGPVKIRRKKNKE